MKHPLFVFKAISGKPHFAEQSEILFRQHLREHEGKTYEIRLRETKRSLSQNAYYWMYLELIVSEGRGKDSAEDLHEFLRRKLLPPKFITVRGEEIKVPRSTTELSKTDFGEYLEKICALVEVPLPNPEDAGYITNY